MKVAIRPARVQDCAALTDLSMRAKQSNGYSDAFMAACRSELTVTAATLARGEHWVVWADEEPAPNPAGIAPVAYACLSWLPPRDEGEVEAFFVAPSSQRTGLGRRLWLFLEARALRAGLKALCLDADPNATSFYAAMGMRRVGASASGSVAGRLLPRMHKSIGSPSREIV